MCQRENPKLFGERRTEGGKKAPMRGGCLTIKGVAKKERVTSQRKRRGISLRRGKGMTW